MTLAELRLQNVRSYDLFSCKFDPNLTLLLGQNGSGKTTILESIYYLLAGTSFRGRDRDMIAHNTTRAELQIIDSSGGKRQATLQETATDTINKTFQIDGRTSKRLLQKHRLPIVMFEPDQLRMLSSSPDRRRRFFDDCISRLYPEYATLLNRYQRTLLQRNELLKQREQMQESAWSDQLFVWDIKFSELAIEIVRMRRDFVVTSNVHLSTLYSNIADSEHRVQASYHSSIPSDDYQQTLLNRLNANKVADSYRGFTSAGPHRDDILVQLDGHPANETASRGEQRTIMLALKLLEVNLQREIHSSTPLILLDDVFSELDSIREQRLMNALAGHQTIITATDVRTVSNISGATVTL